jgi:hypothetical protein
MEEEERKEDEGGEPRRGQVMGGIRLIYKLEYKTLHGALCTKSNFKL